MSTAPILVVDDDPKIVTLVRTYLEREGVPRTAARARPVVFSRSRGVVTPADRARHHAARTGRAGPDANPARALGHSHPVALRQGIDGRPRVRYPRRRRRLPGQALLSGRARCAGEGRAAPNRTRPGGPQSAR